MSDGLTIPSDVGTISVTPAALSALVVRAAESVEGVRVRRPKRGVEIEVEGETARVELELVGVATTQAAAREILASAAFGSGRYTTSFIEEQEEHLPALMAG